jgi:hypothetical protein
MLSRTALLVVDAANRVAELLLVDAIKSLKETATHVEVEVDN